MLEGRQQFLDVALHVEEGVGLSGGVDVLGDGYHRSRRRPRCRRSSVRLSQLLEDLASLEQADIWLFRDSGCSSTTFSRPGSSEVRM